MARGRVRSGVGASGRSRSEASRQRYLGPAHGFAGCMLWLASFGSSAGLRTSALPRWRVGSRSRRTAWRIGPGGRRRIASARRPDPRSVVPWRPGDRRLAGPVRAGRRRARPAASSGRRADLARRPARRGKPASVTAPPATATHSSPSSSERETSSGSSVPARSQCTPPLRSPAHARPMAGAGSRSGPEIPESRSTWPTASPAGASCLCPSSSGSRAGRAGAGRASPRR